MDRIPLLLVGDGPHEPTGLGRIARDLAGLIKASDLPVELVQLGGSVPGVWREWEHYPLDRRDDWGASCTREYWSLLWGKRPGILWVVWDPGRLFHFLDLELPVQLWAYTAIDSTNVHGAISGPAGEALRRFDRVLAYGSWASRVLRRTRDEPASYLPHGLSLETYSMPTTKEEEDWLAETLGPHYSIWSTLIGCVATNQPRKDLSLYFSTLAELRRRGRNVYGWLHTDELVKAWSVQQLVSDFGLEKKITITLGALTDRQMALLYQRCGATIAPGLGEGFGYPIVESLAAGVPVIHGDFGGGAEWLPKTEWRVPVVAERLEGVYALRRPIFTTGDFANAVERALDWPEKVSPMVAAAYCRGAVANLDWGQLWPRWRSWIRAGLAGGGR